MYTLEYEIPADLEPFFDKMVRQGFATNKVDVVLKALTKLMESTGYADASNR